jgi:hypothetical protein
MFRNPTTTMRLGFLFLIFANIALYLVRPGRYPSDLGDGFAGLLMGIAIGLLGLTVWLKSGRGTPRHHI